MQDKLFVAVFLSADVKGITLKQLAEICFAGGRDTLGF